MQHIDYALAARTAVAAGITVLAASGNEGQSTALGACSPQ